ncbi:anti-sigma factor family protein [Blautia sp. MSJ-19]|uniref:anti-sigma factor family protein n=1 Tax=Blautia sp. MSJ-19 TaxID=2841517 RepID=UPI0020A1E2D6|nr:zf-HC2 domain-containing protein [Blautia sp. MSJ-19]
MSDIDCRIAESMVTKYINHTLSINELEEFLDHIEHCSSCYDELETYFIVHEAIQQLDEKDDGSVLDFRELLEQDIRRTRRHIRQKRWLHFLSVLLFSAVLIAVAVFAIFLAMEIKHFL